MKGVIYYYSGSGNTKLACEYLIKKIKSVKFDLSDITKDKFGNSENDDITGFATFTDFCGIPKLFEEFLEKIPRQKLKNAFIFNTFGMMSGGTLRILKIKLEKKGFNVINGFSLHTPENYPPLIAADKGSENSPDENEKQKFLKFLDTLNEQISCISLNKEITNSEINFGGLFRFIPKPPRFIRMLMMGQKSVDTDKCNGCKKCELKCPYKAVKCSPHPVFEKAKCEICWACYNHCPQKAIFTNKLKNKGHYSKPNELFIQKFKD